MNPKNRFPVSQYDLAYEQQTRAMQQQIQKQRSTNVSRASMRSTDVPTGIPGRTMAMPHLQHTPTGLACMGNTPSANQANSVRSHFQTTYPTAHTRSTTQPNPGSLRPHMTLADFEVVPFSETNEIATEFNHWTWVKDMRMTPIPWLVPALPSSKRTPAFQNTLAQVPIDLTRDEGQHEQSMHLQSLGERGRLQKEERVQDQPASATQDQNQWTNYIDLGDEDNDADFVLDKQATLLIDTTHRVLSGFPKTLTLTIQHEICIIKKFVNVHKKAKYSDFIPRIYQQL